MTHIVSTKLFAGPILSRTVELDYPEAGFQSGSEFSVGGTSTTVFIAPVTVEELLAIPELRQLDALIDRLIGRDYNTTLETRDITNDERARIAAIPGTEGRQLFALNVVTSCTHCTQE